MEGLHKEMKGMTDTSPFYIPYHTVR